MNCEDPEQNGATIAELLKHGAHSFVGQEERKAQEGEAFANEDITEILAQRTEKRQIGSRAGNTFSTAQFTAGKPQVRICNPHCCRQAEGGSEGVSQKVHAFPHALARPGCNTETSF